MSDLALQIERYLEELKLQNCSAHTIRAYRSSLDRFLACYPDMPIVGFKPGHFRAWMGGLQDSGLGPGSIRIRVSAVRAFFQTLHRNGLIVVDPTKRIRMPKLAHVIPSVLSIEQVGTLIDGIEAMGQDQPLRDLTVLELLYGCGLRISELVGLNVEDIDRLECWLTIRGKGKKERPVPYGRKAKEALERYLAYRADFLRPGYRNPNSVGKRIQPGSYRADPRENALFLNNDRKRLSSRAVRNIVTGYGIRIMGDAAIHPHSLSHASA